MASINRLGLLVVGITTLAVVLVFGIIVGVRVLLTKTEPPAPSVVPTVAVPTPTTKARPQDSDGDGLSDDIEPIYQTNPSVADTDGDGTSDGDEIKVLRDPLIPGPKDTIDSLSENAKAKIDPATYTGRYLATLPAEATRQDVLSRGKLEAFVEQARLPLLPDVASSDVKTTSDSGKDAVERYLNSISSAQNSNLVAVSSDDITEAFRQAYGQNQPEALAAIVTTLQSNVSVLKTVATPAETKDLHTMFIAASQALLDNVKLIQNMKADFVGGLVGAKNIEELGTTFTDIGVEISDLEIKYSL